MNSEAAMGTLLLLLGGTTYKEDIGRNREINSAQNAGQPAFRAMLKAICAAMVQESVSKPCAPPQPAAFRA
jgi:hypothetical protein